ncbi:hypothetical protein [Lentilactobacillus parafarraginis]|uniref:hypothetical protein n=1 Tax=Lentilactobacillus parafarraginis TaxID=390842 RepID=UPI000A7E197B|nr:hypothetical protein [Lentilactobacillus parafarraginis]
MLDLNQSYTVKADDLYYKNKISAYEGFKVNDRVTTTLLRGHVIYRLDHGFIDKPSGHLLTKKFSGVLQR